MNQMLELSGDQRLLFRYLIDDVTADERDTVEDRCARDDDFFHELVAFENALVDAFAGRRLPAAEREQMERSYFITPERRAKLAFAVALDSGLHPEPLVRSEQTPVNNHKPPRPASWSFKIGFRLATAALALVIAVVITGIIMINARLKNDLRVLRDENARAVQHAASLEQELNRRRTESRHSETGGTREVQASSEAAVSVYLVPVSRGSGGAQEVSIPRGAAAVVIHLALTPEVSSSCTSCKLWLETADGVLVLRSSLRSDRANPGDAFVRLPVRLFPHGDYLLKIMQDTAGKHEELAAYSLRVKEL